LDLLLTAADVAAAVVGSAAPPAHKMANTTAPSSAAIDTFIFSGDLAFIVNSFAAGIRLATPVPD
jgi:hypothetical protein